MRKGYRQLAPTNGAMSNPLSFSRNHAKSGNHAGFGQYHLKLEWTGRRGLPLRLPDAPHIAGG